MTIPQLLILKHIEELLKQQGYSVHMSGRWDPQHHYHTSAYVTVDGIKTKHRWTYVEVNPNYTIDICPDKAPTHHIDLADPDAFDKMLETIPPILPLYKAIFYRTLDIVGELTGQPRHRHSSNHRRL